jgi:hypothetical protein
MKFDNKKVLLDFQIKLYTWVSDELVSETADLNDSKK